MNRTKKNRKALVTGGTRGIGYAVAHLLAASDCEVWVTGTQFNGRGPSGTHYLACDFTDRNATQTFARKISKDPYDMLINNAGINKVGPVSDYNPEDFETIQQVNLTAPFLLCQAVLPGMLQRRYGRIVNITSLFSVVSREGRFAYSTSKSGLAGMTRALALEAAKDNVLINCVAPGFIDTDLSRQILGEKGMMDMAQKIPMRRLGKPEEIAKVVQFLVSEENSYMTGQNIVIDGGYTCE